MIVIEDCRQMFKKSTFSDDNYFSYRESKKRNYSDYGRNISMVSLN